MAQGDSWDNYATQQLFRDIAEALESVTGDLDPPRAIPIHGQIIYREACRRLSREERPAWTRIIKASDLKPYQVNLYGSARSSLIAVMDCLRHSRGESQGSFAKGYVFVVPGGAFTTSLLWINKLVPNFDISKVLGPPRSWDMPKYVEPRRPTKLDGSDWDLVRDLYGQ